MRQVSVYTYRASSLRDMLLRREIRYALRREVRKQKSVLVARVVRAGYPFTSLVSRNRDLVSYGSHTAHSTRFTLHFDLSSGVGRDSTGIDRLKVFAGSQFILGIEPAA